MHSILWASILASAGVAVVTTLLVEYLAKPSLEARKDRILEQSRAKREVEFQLGIMVGLSGSLILDVSPDDFDDSEEDIIIDLLEERRTEIIAACKTVRRAMGVVGIKIDRPVRDVIYKAIGWVEVYASACDVGIENTGLALAIVSGRALDMYHTHWWQVQKRRKLTAKGTSLPDTTDPPSLETRQGLDRVQGAYLRDLPPP